MLLAIDTATRTSSLALHDGRSLLAENTWLSDNNHNVQLAPAVERLLRDCGVSMDLLTAVAVTVGPGSYTGLRIGLALAKGIAGVRGLPLIGVTTLDVLASAQPHAASSGLVVVVQAGRGRVISGVYRWYRNRWVTRGQPRLMNWEELFATIDGPAHLTGEIDAEGFKACADAQAAGIPVEVAPAVYRLRRAGFLAEEALARLATEDEDFTAAKINPIYIKTQGVPIS